MRLQACLVQLGVRARALRVLLVVGVAFAALPVGSALADTTVGETGDPSTSNYYLNSGFEDAQINASMPAAGTVTSFHTQSSSCSYVGAGAYNFQVLRPLGSNEYLVLGETGNQTDPCNSVLNSYPVSIPVKTGDVLGVYVVSAWEGVLTAGSGTIQFNPISEPVVGETVTLPESEAFTADESASLALPHWYAGGNELAEGQPQRFTSLSGGQSRTFTLNTPTGPISCQLKDEETIENPAGGGAGTDEITKFKLRLCHSEPDRLCKTGKIVGKVSEIIAHKLPWVTKLVGTSPTRDEIQGVELEIKCEGGGAIDTYTGTLSPTVGEGVFEFGAGSGELEDGSGNKATVTGTDKLRNPVQNKDTITAK